MPARDTLTPDESRFLEAHRVGHLATSDAAGRPHVVPVCYAFDDDRFYIALDEKPKRVPDARLRRVRNLVERPEASLVVDYYDQDWSRLGYVLIHARAEFLQPDSPGHANAVALLRARYPQYQTMVLESRPIIALAPDHIVSWGSLVSAGQYGSLPAEASGRGVDFLLVARGRRSVRQYQKRAVPRLLIERILEAAAWAPSPHGRQPWRFVVLTQPELRARLAQAMGSEWKRNLEMDGEPAEVVAIRLEKSHQRFVHAPVIVIPCLYLAELDQYADRSRQSAEETMAVQSLGAAVQNMLLAAYSLGLDTGWMCAPLFCPEVVSRALGLEAALTPHALITLGYAASDPARRPHRPLDELIARWD